MENKSKRDLDEFKYYSKRSNTKPTDKEYERSRRNEKSRTKTEPNDYKRRRELSRNKKDNLIDIHVRKDSCDEKDRKNKRPISRSSSEKSSRKRSRSRHRTRNYDRHPSCHKKNRSQSREYDKESRREPREDLVDQVDEKTREILKTIEIPKEIRQNRDLVAKYQADQLKKKAEEMAGVKIPNFYNTSHVNPLLLAEQQRKRKLLWSKSKDNENTSTQLIGKAIVQGQDEKTAEKFRKLMGIKSTVETNDDLKTAINIQSMAQKAFDSMDKEYEYARVTTHLNRGKGLGFASHAANLLMDANQRLQFQ